MGVVITAMVGPLVVERHKPDRITREPTEPAVIAKHATDAVALIQSAISLVQSEISDLQTRIGRLETLQMADAHGQR